MRTGRKQGPCFRPVLATCRISLHSIAMKMYRFLAFTCRYEFIGISRGSSDILLDQPFVQSLSIDSAQQTFPMTYTG